MDATHPIIVAEVSQIGKSQISLKNENSVQFIGWQMVCLFLRPALEPHLKLTLHTCGDCHLGFIRGRAFTLKLIIQRAFVFPGAAILGELNDEENYCSYQ